MFGVLYIEIYKSTLATDAGLQGNTFFHTMVLTDSHDDVIGFAGPQTNVALDDAFFAAFATSISGHSEAPFVKALPISLGNQE